MQDHIIICGLGHVGYRIAELLHTLGVEFAVITRELKPAWRDTLTTWATRIVEGDARQEAHLYAAGILQARSLLVVTDSDLENIEIALDAQRINPTIPITVRVFDHFLQDRIARIANVCNVFSPAMLTAPVFVAAALGEEMMRVFNIEDCQLNIVRLPFPPGATGIGQSVQAFCVEHNLTPIALHRERTPCGSASEAGDSDNDRTDANRLLVPDKSVLCAGDTLLAAISGADTERLWTVGHLAGLHPHLWETEAKQGGVRAFVKRMWRSACTIDDIWRRTTPVLRGAVKAILLLVAFSTALFRYTVPEVRSWVDALYFVTTIMTTVGFGDFHLREAPGWLKIYGCLMMISGLTLMTILISIVTDYIVTLRVEQSLGRRPTRLTNHVVVVGLGDVGSRVVEELRRMGIPVLAMERAPEHESVPELQDQIQVIIADANRDSALQLANIPQARAIIVTVTSDSVSLQVAHRAERMNPRLRSVMRLYDSNLARKIRGDFGMESSVNAAATAAATFVASALQRDVVEGFTLDGRLFLLRWLKPGAEAHDAQIGRNVLQAREAGCLVLLKKDGLTSSPRPALLTDRIAPDDPILILEEYDPLTHSCIAPRLLLVDRATALPSDAFTQPQTFDTASPSE